MGSFYLDNQQNGWLIEWRYKDDKRGVMINHSLLKKYIAHNSNDWQMVYWIFSGDYIFIYKL